MVWFFGYGEQREDNNEVSRIAKNKEVAMNEVVFIKQRGSWHGTWYHRPCAVIRKDEKGEEYIDEFPARGQLIPSTIMSDVLRYYTCNVCGNLFWEESETAEKGV